ncbi:hypothetical protein KQI82_06165 [Oscillibacter sp. MSJ-2]|uniref:DUF6291 domain-containing protein n=1 Tax=Dysosmobacter acutus TaxID=2841504 RepID=A0ABS6F8U8_9FIRM|nr:DUF6291 domain-containing protein [Dysosmobacter acutus]MBU5626503.1 hypothetical protein [Dysosmobacter acutus]
MEYIKIPIICVEAILALGEAERGRLLRSLLVYGSGGGAAEGGGNEKTVFLVLKAQMDKDAKSRERERERKREQRWGQVGTSWDKPGQLGTSWDTPFPLSSPPTPPVPISLTPKEKPPKGGKKKPLFSPPTAEEAKAYCAQYGIEAERFVDYYAAQGWKLSNGNPMKDWRAAVRNWAHRRAGAEGKEDWSVDG